MSTPVIAFFNNKGGVGKTSLVYHIAWMLAEQGYKVLTADLDPQGNLSAAFVAEDRLEELWPENQHPATIYGESVHSKPEWVTLLSPLWKQSVTVST